MITIQQLVEIMPHLTSVKAGQYRPFLVEAMDEAGIITRARAAAFLAQLAHESGELRWFEELPHRRRVPGCHLCEKSGPHAAGAQYEGRIDLGNSHPGDGRRYKGRGPIQLTGRLNYRECGKSLGIHLEDNPILAAQPEIGFRIAGWFWRTRGCNELADVGDFRGVSLKINGGHRAADGLRYPSGWEQRQLYYSKALEVLSAPPIA
jgi:predicted chitinase